MASYTPDKLRLTKDGDSYLLDLTTRVSANQGAANEGKVLGVNSTGDVVPVDPSAAGTVFTGATASANGAKGLVPAPVIGDQEKVLTGAGTWAVTKNVQSAVSDPSADGTGITFIDTISQNTQGVIAPTKKTVRTFGGATSEVAGSTGLVPAPAVADRTKYLKGDGTWNTVELPSDMTGATDQTAGVHGLVPAPAAGDQGKVLLGSGAWAEKADKSLILSVTLLSTGWSETTPPTQSVTAVGVTANNNVVVGLGGSTTLEQLEAYSDGKIVCTAQGMNSLTFTCYEDVPDVNIPVTVAVLG